MYIEKSEFPGVRNFFLSLGGQWEMVADYLGYSRDEIEQILQRFPDSIENQVYLHLCSLPLLYLLLCFSPSVPLLSRSCSCSILHQVAEFLEVWQVPSTGQLSLPLLHKLKALSGVTNEHSRSRRLVDRKGTCNC